MKLDGVRILVVEDSPTQAEEIEILLRSEGAIVARAPDGESGWEKYLSASFAIVLSDVVMPGMSGFDLCRRIKGSEGGDLVPVILVTSLSDPVDIVEGLDAGADNFITKPYEAEYLVERVRRVLDERAAVARDKVQVAADVEFMGRKIRINAGKTQILSMLVTAFEEAVRKSRDLEKKHRDLEKAKSKVEEYARRLEGLVKVSEEKFNVLLENAHDAIFTLDHEGRILSMNRGGERMFGVGRGEVIGREFLDLVPADLRAKANAGFLRRRDAIGVVVDEIGLVRGDGGRFFAEIAISRATLGDETLLLVMVRDVTERVATEERNEVQRAVTSVLADTGSFEEAAPRLLESVCVALDWQWAVFWGVDRASGELRSQAAWASPGIDMAPYLRDSEGIVDGPGVGSPGRAWQSRRVVWIPDISLDRNLAPGVPAAQRVQETAIRMSVAIPIMCEGAVVAVMVLGRREPGEPDDQLIRTFEVLGDHIGQYIERKRGEEKLELSEEEFRQAQKMEAMGRLASGVAHDFNNLLTVISGYGEMLLEKERPDDPEHGMISAITKAADRASELTRQLLAFGRKQKLVPGILDLNAVVEDARKILGRIIGEDVELTASLKPGLGAIRADPGQINQVIMNLAVNARDAMPEGGRILIETSETVLDNDAVGLRPMMEPGRYVQLSVTDTGIGMDADTKARIFEPFFTTKEQGKGTGLGLSTVYGIVQQSGGHIFVHSEPGHGTCFKMYFPSVEGEASASGSPPAEKERPVGTREAVLVVEDESAIRGMVCDALKGSGYEVVSASGSREALALFDLHLEKIALLLTDVVMPGMQGIELAERVTAGEPGLRVLFMSGYSEQAALERALLKPGYAYLQKPFTLSALLRKVSEVLGP